ncbi:MAG TPA: matrixin family metalloprotease [Pyrinomonadaceae bacterium]|nr:matrixin family metalloprotease [Pyrinomonadaceae bacterium]
MQDAIPTFAAAVLEAVDQIAFRGQSVAFGYTSTPLKASFVLKPVVLKETDNLVISVNSKVLLELASSRQHADNLLLYVLMHEIGHAIGVKHTSGQVLAVMSSYGVGGASRPIVELQADDVAAVRSLYGRECRQGTTVTEQSQPSQAPAARPANATRQPELTTQDMTQFISPQLTNDPGARVVARFCVGHIIGNFDWVSSSVQTYLERRNRLFQAAPNEIAQKRYQEMMEEERRVFLTGRGPFFYLIRPVQTILPSGTKVTVQEWKQGTTAYQTVSFRRYFVKLEYPNPNTAPQGTDAQDRPRRIKQLYLVVPVVQAAFIAAVPRGDGMNSFNPFNAEPFVPQLEIVQGSAEFY